MTDEEYAAMAAKLGLAGEGLKSPSQMQSIYATQAEAPAIPSLLSPQYAISNSAAGTPISAGREDLNRFATDRPGSQGLTTTALQAVIAPEQTGAGMDSSALNKAIDDSMRYHQEKAAGQQASLSRAAATLGDLDATDAQKEQAHATIQNIPTVYDRAQDKDVVVNPVPNKNSLLSAIQNQYPDLSDSDAGSLASKLQRDAFVAHITPPDSPSIAALKRTTNLNTGPSYRALQDLGIQFPGTTSKYATAPVFQADAPPPAQKIERAQPVPGQTVDASGKVVQAPASSIGLNTVRGTEFGQIDNPARGGYTEAGWNVGAWGGDIAETKTPFVALPTAILSKYGNPGDKKFADDFNSKYDVQVTDPATGKVVVASVRDKGPGAKTGAGIDMGWATREQLGLQPGFSGNIAYRVVPKGSGLPDNTTPSVQQTQQNAQAQTGNFATGPNPAEVYIKPIDTSRLKDPSVHGTSMTTADIAQWSRHQADEYAGAMDDAGTPLTMAEYKEQYQKFFEGGQKYQNAEIKLEPVSPEHNNQFMALANLVSPTGTAATGSQLDAILTHFEKAKKEGLVGGFGLEGAGATEARRMFDSAAEHLAVPISKGLFGQTGVPSNADIENAKKVLPGEWDTTGPNGTAARKIADIKQSVRDHMRLIIQINKAEHHDTSALEQQYRQLFVQSSAAQAATDKANRTNAQNKVIANATQQQTPQQRRAATEATTVTNPPPSF